MLSVLAWREQTTRSVVERKLVGLPRGDAFFEVPSANRLVSLVAADLDLRSVSQRLTVLAQSQHHGGFAAATAATKPSGLGPLRAHVRNAAPLRQPQQKSLVGARERLAGVGRLGGGASAAVRSASPGRSLSPGRTRPRPAAETPAAAAPAAGSISS